MEESQPLILCMENAAGQEVTLRIEPEDDFQRFLDKAKSVLGYDIDTTSLTNGQPVDLNENVYRFLLNLELNQLDLVQTFDPTFEPSDPNDNQEYILDDGTEIRASQIHFDNEDAPIDLTLETLPFVKLNHEDDSDTVDGLVFDEVTYKIAASPISSVTASPKHNFNIPFKLVCNNTTGFEAQFTRYLQETTKTYATLNNVTKKNKSPRSLIKDNFNSKEEFRYTREEILNMLKDSPVTSIPYEVNDKKHVRKTDPTRMIQKSAAKALDIDGLVIGDGENRNCFICDKNVIGKLYVFDKEDQKIHKCSPQKIISTQLKVICEHCLNENFKPSRMKGPNQFLSSDEYLVIKNNQQYIFQKTKNFKFRMDTIDKVAKKKKTKEEFVKVEIGSDGEIVTKPIDNDDVIIINDDRKDSSSDVELVEAEPEIDKIIDNLDEADEEVKQFLGRYEDNDNGDQELKCRFCEQMFPSTAEVMSHGETHKHDLEDDVVYPCPLCDYGYSTFNWLKGHIKAAHENKNMDIKQQNKEPEVDTSKEPGTSIETTISLNTDAEKRGESEKNVEGTQNLQSDKETNHRDLIIKTEVKQESMSSDEEIWIVQTADTEDTGQLGNKPKDNGDKGKKGHKCHNCSQFFPSAAALTSHKCRRRKRKSDNDACAPKDATLKGQPKKSKDGSEIVTCHECDQSFTSKVRLKFHMQFHEGGALAQGGFSCGQCAAPCATETELFDHVHFRHDKRKRWLCPLPGCGKTFYLRATLTKHSRTHTDTRRYVCVKCGKRFFDKQTLDEHGVTHLQIKPYECPICRKQLTRVSRLRMHVRAHRERAAPARLRACAQCARAFRDTDHAQEHAIKSVECMEALLPTVKEEPEEPAVQLSPTSGLVRHTVQVIESPEPKKRIKRQVASPVAEPLLSDLTDDARALIRVVEIDKAFRCEYCEDVFYIEEGLNKHRSIHKGVKNPFTCHICKVSFATYSRCTTHKTTHGFYKRGPQERALPDFPVVKHFLCEDCGRSYLHWTYLQVHRRMKHPNNNYQHNCTHCHMTFPNSWSLAYHRKKMHGKAGQPENTKSTTQNYSEVFIKMVLSKELRSMLEATGGNHDIYAAMDSGDLAVVVRAATGALRKIQCLPPEQPLREKSAEESNRLRTQGNNHYVNGEYKEAIAFYNKALAFAPPNSSQLQMAYGNISSVMLAIKAYQACQMNIQACLDTDCPKPLRDKLEKRFKETHKFINQEMMRDVMIRSDEVLFDYMKFDVVRNAEIPCASEDVDVRNEDGSKKAVAAKDIAPCKIVAMERAFVSVQDDQHQYSSCYYCHRICLFFIPCDGCCQALFCTKQCRDSCMKDHHCVECRIVDYFGSLYEDSVVKLMTRAAIKLSLSLTWEELRVASLDVGARRLKKSTVKEAFDAGSPLSMLCYDDQSTVVHGKIYNGSVICAAIVHCLSRVPDYFPEEASEREKAIDTISRVMLHLYATFNRRIEIVCSTYDFQVKTYKCGVQRNIGWFSFTSKLAHSCEPNMFVVGLNDRVALVALRPVKKGEELTISYVIPCRDCDEVLPNKNTLYKHRKKEHSDDAAMQEQIDAGNTSLGESVSRKTCPRKFHPYRQHLTVIEIQGVNPSPEEVMRIIDMNYICQDRIIDISLMSFIKGTTNLVPNCARALAMLSNVPKTEIQYVKPRHNTSVNPVDDYPPCPENLSTIRRPAILQRSENIYHPQIMDGRTQNIQDLNVELLLQDCVTENTEQISQLDLNEPVLE